MKLSEITEESTEAQVAQALTDNIVEKFKNVCPGPAIDTMTDDEVKAELDRRGIDPIKSFRKMQQEIHNCKNDTIISTAQLIAQLSTEGGAIVCTSDCSIIEIADAQVTGRMFVDDDGIGFVRRTKEWLALQKSREAGSRMTGNFEDWVRTNTNWSTDSRNGVYLDIRTAHAFIAWESKRMYILEIIEMKEKVRRLEEQLLLSDYHKEGKGVF
jgi:hypothetical protein